MRPAIFLYFILLLILVHLELVNMRDAGPTHDEFSAPQHIHNTQHQHIPPRTGTAIVIRSAAGDDRSPKVTHRARSGCVHSETLPPRRSTFTDKVRVRVAGGVGALSLRHFIILYQFYKYLTVYITDILNPRSSKYFIDKHCSPFKAKLII